MNALVVLIVDVVVTLDAVGTLSCPTIHFFFTISAPTADDGRRVELHAYHFFFGIDLDFKKKSSPAPMPVSLHRAAVAAFVKLLDRSVVERCGTRRIREFKLPKPPSLAMRALIGRFNAGSCASPMTPTLMCCDASCYQMGLTDDASAIAWNDMSLTTLLLVFATPDEIKAMRRCPRLDAGLALMSVRECAQMHAWHNKTHRTRSATRSLRRISTTQNASNRAERRSGVSS